MTLKWRYCGEVERDHRANQRNYAHTGHFADTICISKGFWELPKVYRDGILIHEIGHLLAGLDQGEEEANEAAEELLGARIRYVDSEYGNQLEKLANMPRRRNARRPISEEQREHERLLDRWAEVRSTISAMEREGEIVPDHLWNELDALEARGYHGNPAELAYDEWIPTHAVRFNSDGTVSLMAEGPKASQRENYDWRTESFSDLAKQGFMRSAYKTQKPKKQFDVFDENGDFRGTAEGLEAAKRLASNFRHPRIVER